MVDKYNIWVILKRELQVRSFLYWEQYRMKLRAKVQGFHVVLVNERGNEVDILERHKTQEEAQKAVDRYNEGSSPDAITRRLASSAY